MALRIHLPNYPELPLPGKERYADRAMLLPGVVFVRAGEEVHDYRRFLNDIGIGAEIVVQVPEDDLFQGILESGELRSAVHCFVLGGGKLQFFNSTAREEMFLQQLGLGWEDTISAPAEISALADNKAALRKLAMELGLTGLFPAHVFCRKRAEALAGVEMLQKEAEPDFIVLKRPDLASGLGLVKLRTDNPGLLKAQVESYFSKYGEARELILEAGYEHLSLSVLWNIESDDEKPLIVSRQLVDERFVHQGNIISSGLPPEVSVADGGQLVEKSSLLAKALRERGFRGICGFDFMKTRSGNIFCLECNGRITATVYAYGLARQIEAERGHKPWAVHMQNLHPENARNFAELRAKLEPDLFDGQYGILPFNVRCLSLAEPKCGLMCVAEGAEEAAFLFESAVEATKK
ncbi:hypothetical protein HYT45_02350 [Candidatus Uhrbacteria bacterium]|nr:hypothetical protein [Candidatus Uhrbacteria bacterium]